MGVHLPGGQLVGRGDVGHRRQGGVERSDIGNRVPLDQHAVVAAELGSQGPPPLHGVDRQRIGVADDRYRRDHRDRGVAVDEHEIAPVLGREAVDRVGLAAGPLREAGPPLAELEEVRLHVDHEPSRWLRGAVGVVSTATVVVGSPWIVVVASSGSVAAVSGTVNLPPGSVPVERDRSSLQAWRIASPDAIPADDSRNRRRDHRWRRA